MKFVVICLERIGRKGVGKAVPVRLVDVESWGGRHVYRSGREAEDDGDVI